jgi:hypothetical protein|tara:strand:+ start:1703 stop:2089 length:387 start_codon:yes stop_codon:yes gene_type:complete
MSGIIGTSHSKSKVIGGSKDTAKAWCTINTPGTGTHVKYSSYNISGITDQGVGQTRYTFTSAMSDYYYVVTGTCDSGTSAGSIFFTDEDVGAASYYGKTTTYFQTRNRNSNSNAMEDSRDSMVVIFGD